jgi:SMC interacting uncharacterized protein involved in chromosome segregation
MTFEERIQKLTERHDALIRTLERRAAEHRDYRRQMEAENRQLDRRMGEIMEGISRLVHVAEQRSDRR